MTLADKAYFAINSAILGCQLDPGEVLTIDGLAGQLGMSRSPVQDALRDLAGNGLVTVKRHNGHYVSPLTLDALRGAFEARLGVECLAAQLTAERASDSQLAEFEARSASLPVETSLLVRRPDFIPVYEAVTGQNGFHLRLALLSGNPFLVRAIAGTLAPITRASVLYFGRGSAISEDVGADSHEPILEAVRSRDPKRAVNAITDHLTEAFNQVRSLFGTELSPAAAGPVMESYVEAFAK